MESKPSSIISGRNWIWRWRLPVGRILRRWTVASSLPFAWCDGDARGEYSTAGISFDPRTRTEPPRETLAKRAHPAHRGILSLFIAAIFAYLLLVFLGPFVLGPWALLVAAAIGGFLVVIARRHVRRRGRRPHIDFTLGWRQSARAREVALAREVAFTFMLSAFLVFIIVLGVALQVSSPTIGSGAVLFALGGGLINLAIFIGLGILAEGDPRYALGVPFIAEEQDTTEDH